MVLQLRDHLMPARGIFGLAIHNPNTSLWPSRWIPIGKYTAWCVSFVQLPWRHLSSWFTLSVDELAAHSNAKDC